MRSSRPSAWVLQVRVHWLPKRAGFGAGSPPSSPPLCPYFLQRQKSAKPNKHGTLIVRTGTRNNRLKRIRNAQVEGSSPFVSTKSRSPRNRASCIVGDPVPRGPEAAFGDHWGTI